ncbi:ankyrin repeat domain-containing protein 9 [Gadus chalcogrammus]|uniref:ankyrin repeat domain-containing protein 9 n=1 Tax=Gadus chalcogrammus TaxID=1042646 RepID=UPI0024C42348|nr:ankyrin repeat domain-containing protein 9 [Gadus chalcogrammus]XP_056445904.1 ankyrin repeat domain-containing protein 9 [Gadus chalcogrammus]
MPWDVEVQHGEGRSDYKSEKRCQRTSLAFYQAVRDGLPPWLLEDMRRMEVFHWEADGQARAFSPAEALLYALVHDHQAYARHLLAGFSVAALEPPSGSFRCCGASGPPHLAAAVRYGRVAILKMMLTALKDLPSEGARRRFLDGGGGCPHDADGGKTAVRLACDLLRPECLLLLLAHGASPGLGDGADGATPLDALLRRMGGEPARGAAEARARRVCLGYLLLFTPRPHQGLHRRLAEREPEQWRRLVGTEAFRWLAGAASPPSLFVRAMQTLVRSVPAERLDCLPGFLKPIDFPL